MPEVDDELGRMSRTEDHARVLGTFDLQAQNAVHRFDDVVVVGITDEPDVTTD
jgi:hypothetical protein